MGIIRNGKERKEEEGRGGEERREDQEIIPILLKLYFPNIFYEAIIFLIAKPEKDTTTKKIKL
jgi:hypothetical protein